MATYVGQFFTAVSSALEFNSATLSGAIDVIVTEDENGGRHCTPFYVRFGKLQLLKSRGIPVDIVLNDVRTDLRMYLGAAGEAYFYDSSLADRFQTTSGNFPFSNDQTSNPLDSNTDDSGNAQDSSTVLPSSSTISPATMMLDVPITPEIEKDEEQTTNPTCLSPINTPTTTEALGEHDDLFHTRAIRSTSDLGFQNFAYMSDSEIELTRAERDGTVEAVDEPRSPPISDMQRRWSSQWARGRSVLLTNNITLTDLPHGISSTGVDPEKEATALPLRADPSEDQLSSLFGLPGTGESSGIDQNTTITQSHSCPEAAVLNSTNISGSGVDSILDDSPIIAPSCTDAQIEQDEDLKLELRSVDECEEQEDLIGMGIKEKLDEALIESEDFDSEGVIEMSLCGRAIRSGMSDGDIMAIFNEYRVTRADFEADPAILYDAALLFRIEDRLVNFKVAAPFVMAMLAFKTPLDLEKLSKKVSEPVVEKPTVSPTPQRRFGGWFGWSSPPVVGEPLLNQEDLDAIESQDLKNASKVPDIDQAALKEDGKADATQPVKNNQLELENEAENVELRNELAETAEGSSRAGDLMILGQEANDALTQAVADEALERQASEEAIFAEADYDSECFSFLPSTEQLHSLDLKPGANEIRFVISSRSACELRCRIFLWSNDSKIVISDVDGTITRSDVLGHLLPGVGLDWSQVGVAGLYSLIAKNGYKMLYLTARPIGQASQTRDFLHSVTQGPSRLPNGPVLMSPNRLVESFTREVIRRKPQEFKIACLRAVRSLFPLTYNPFHAGFGNRDTDVISYRAVGLIPQRIFVVNPRGELVVMNTSYESTASYSSLQTLVENVFPDITGKFGLEWIRHATETATYNDWNYWRGTLPDLDIDALLSEKNP